MQGAVTIERIDSLNFSNNNPNKGNVEAIIDSVKEFGFNDCVVAYGPDTVRNVKAGEHRLKAAAAEGKVEVPVFWLDVASEDEADAYMLADNRIASNSRWDLTKLATAVDGFSTFTGTGFGSASDLMQFASTVSGFGGSAVQVSIGDFSFEIPARQWADWEEGLRYEASTESTDAASILKARLGLF
jgi:hypothetical protein